MQAMFLDKMISDPEGYTLKELLDAWWFEPEELATFLNGMISFGVIPQPDQGDGEEDEYEGQPVVWDGGFEWRSMPYPGIEHGGFMFYVGSDGSSVGSGKQVERQVYPEDRIIFSRQDD